MEITKHTQNILVKSYQCDRYGYLRPIMLMNFLQGAAASHAQELGAGRTYCEEHNIAWVVTHNMVDIIELPKFKDRVVLKTWPSMLSLTGRMDPKSARCSRAPRSAAAFWEQYKRVVLPEIFKVDLSEKLYEIKQKLLEFWRIFREVLPRWGQA